MVGLVLLQLSATDGFGRAHLRRRGLHPGIPPHLQCRRDRRLCARCVLPGPEAAQLAGQFLRGFKQWWDAAYPAFADAVVSDQDYLYRQREKFKETAFYGELTWHATDSVGRCTGGFRHFRDESDTRVQQTTGLYSSIIDSSDSSGSESDSDTLFKGQCVVEILAINQLYATDTEGYRRGGTNGHANHRQFCRGCGLDHLQGRHRAQLRARREGAVGRMTYNANVFYVDWSDPQINGSTTNWGFFAVQNADEASTRDIELEIAGWRRRRIHLRVGLHPTWMPNWKPTVAADGALPGRLQGDRLPGAPGTASMHQPDTIPLAFGLLTIRGRHLPPVGHAQCTEPEPRASMWTSMPTPSTHP